MIQQAPEPDRFRAEMCEASINDKAAEALLDRDQAEDFSWESNRELPWPEENESKE